MTRTKSVFSKQEMVDFKRVQRIYKRLDTAMISLSYELGDAVNSVMEHAKADCEMYDAKVIEKFSAALDCTPHILYGAGRVFRAWPDKVKFQKLVKLQHTDDGWQLTWTHFLYLSHTGVARRRQALAEQAFNGKWSVSKLLKLLAKRKNKVKENRGRPGKLVPKSINDCLLHMITQSTHIVNIADTNWFGDSYNIINAIAAEPLDKITTGIVEEMNQAVCDLRAVASSFITYADDMQRTADSLTQKKEAKPPKTLREPASATKHGDKRGRRGKTGPLRAGRPGV